MALTRSLRGLADRLRRRPDPPAASAPTMRWVHDEEAAAIVPGTIRREADVMRWLDRAPAHGGTLMLFPVDGAIVTENYVPIDPARGLAFIDQSFDNVPVPTGRPRPVAGETFALPAQTVTDIAGRVVVIGGIMAGNYFHGLMNWLARFPTLELLAPAIYRDPDVRFLVDEEVRAEPFMSILRALGVPLDRVIWHAHREADVRIEHALLPTFLHEGLICGDVYRAMQARIFQTLGVAWPERPRRRIWISREHEANARRRIANIAEIAPALDAHGFERVALETLSFAD